MYQSLFVTGRDYLSQPQLCKTYKVSEDMKSYTFYIEKATFSNNTPLTIQDVLASLEEAKKSDYYGGRFQHIVEMSVTEDGGLLIPPLKTSPFCWISPLSRQFSWKRTDLLVPVLMFLTATQWVPACDADRTGGAMRR